MFLKEAAENAGINSENLLIVFEQEAASIYCQYMYYQDSVKYPRWIVNPGDKYMVVDIGGEKTNISVHEKAEDNTLVELIPSSDGHWGGKSVRDEFFRFLSELVGENAMDQLKENHLEDYVELCRYFEDKCKMVPLHTNAIDGIVKHIDENLVKDVGTIVLVGGFSECGLLQKAVREFFKGKNIIIPADAGLATLKGAVFFGHIPEAISRRSAMYSYGIQTWIPFDKKHHPENKKTDLEGTRCKDVFFTFVQKGERIYPGLTKSQVFYTLEPTDRVDCHVYLSDRSNPRFIDDESCRQLGILEIQLPELKKCSRREIRETMTFGETDLKVEAEDLFTGIVSEVTFDLLLE